MNTRILNALVVLLLVGTMTCTSVHMQNLENIKNTEFKSDNEGQAIVDTIQLQLQTGQSVDNVVRLLQELVSGLNKQQKASDQDHLVKNAAWRKLIAQYNSTIISLKIKVLKVNRQIQISLRKIKNDQRSIRINSAQIKLVSAKIQSLIEARRIDVKSTKARVARQQEILKAINYIIVQLQQMLVAKSFVQLNNIKEKLQTLVKENPIQALVQLTMTFNPESVHFAVKKLSEVRDAIVSSLKDEEVQEIQAYKQFRTLKIELVAFLHSAHLQLDHNRANLARHQKNLANQQADLKQTQVLLALNEKLLAVTIQARHAYNVKYQQDKKERAREIVVLHKVEAILTKDIVNTNAAEASRFTSALKN